MFREKRTQTRNLRKEFNEGFFAVGTVSGQHEVFKTVVVFDAVKVVNYLALDQWTPDMPRHDEAMVCHIQTTASVILRHRQGKNLFFLAKCGNKREGIASTIRLSPCKSVTLGSRWITLPTAPGKVFPGRDRGPSSLAASTTRNLSGMSLPVKGVVVNNGATLEHSVSDVLGYSGPGLAPALHAQVPHLRVLVLSLDRIGLSANVAYSIHVDKHTPFPHWRQDCTATKVICAYSKQ